MIRSLELRQSYEDRYDHSTVNLCRAREDMLRRVIDKARKEGLPKLTGKDKDKDPEREFAKVINLSYYSMVDCMAGDRWEERERTINEWMAKDEAKDRQLNEARLSKEPICQHCNKTGLRIIDKLLMNRSDDIMSNDEEVLFMLECTHCHKRSSIWQDGARWERRKTHCPKCRAVMIETSTRKGYILTDTYVCPSCSHSYKETLDLTPTKSNAEEFDPLYETDQARFCLTAEQGAKYLEGKRNLESLGKLMDEMKEKEANKALYDAVGSLQKVNIGQLTTVLQSALDMAKYSEPHFEQPDMGKDVTIAFSCLDTKADRSDYDSRNTLKKAVAEALHETNWRLMSSGIDYRLGYLTGRLRAYEREEDLLALVRKDKKLIEKFAKKASDIDVSTDEFLTVDGREVRL